MPFDPNNPYDPNGGKNLGGTYAFGNKGPTNVIGIPVAQGMPAKQGLDQYGLPNDATALNNITQSSQTEAPFVGLEQQLTNQMQGLDPNASVGQQLRQNQSTAQGWENQGLGQMQSAYDTAKSYAAGADTAAYKQLGRSQQTGNALGLGAAQGAGGGARGAAAARGALQDQAGSTMDMQRAALAQQKAQDQQQYAGIAAGLGNQLMGAQLGQQQQVAQWQNAQGQLQGQYQQLGDTATLGAGSMLEGLMSQNYGLSQGSAQQYLQQQEQNAQTQQQLFAAGVNAMGSGLGAAGSSGGGGGGAAGGGGNGPYGLGNNPENPWWNG